MKQLSNTPEAVAAVTGLSPEAVRERMADLFGNHSRRRFRSIKRLNVPQCAVALLQTNQV